jgi:hypothetical protein
MAFSTAVYTQVLVNTRKQTLIRNLSTRILLPIFVNSSSGVTVAKPVNEMYVGVFFIGKRHVYSSLSQNTSHTTNSTALFAI